MGIWCAELGLYPVKSPCLTRRNLSESWEGSRRKGLRIKTGAARTASLNCRVADPFVTPGIMIYASPPTQDAPKTRSVSDFPRSLTPRLYPQLTSIELSPSEFGQRGRRVRRPGILAMPGRVSWEKQRSPAAPLVLCRPFLAPHSCAWLHRTGRTRIEGRFQGPEVRPVYAGRLC